jgi:hypothetical protein
MALFAESNRATLILHRAVRPVLQMPLFGILDKGRYSSCKLLCIKGTQENNDKKDKEQHV